MMATVHQQQVAPGGTIRANKRWRNVGASGTRDIYALYGSGDTLDTFITEFGGAMIDQYCAAGAEVTTPVDCTVPVGASPGLRNALVGVAEYVYPTIIFDDYDIVPDAIEVIAGVISIGYFWYEGLDGWEQLLTTPKQIPENKDIYVAIGWVNQSESNMVGHMDLAVTYPDGTTLDLLATGNQDQERTPGNGVVVEFEPFLSSQLGTYTLVPTLSSGGQVLDTLPLFLEAVAAAPAQITIGFRGINYPAWVIEEEILVWDGATQVSGRHSPGTTAYFTIPGGLELVRFQFNLWGEPYPDGIGRASALGPPQDGSVYPMDITLFFGF